MRKNISNCQFIPELPILSIEGEKIHGKGIRSIFNIIIVENCPNLGKAISFQIPETFKILNRQDQKNSHATVKLKQ